MRVGSKRNVGYVAGEDEVRFHRGGIPKAGGLRSKIRSSKDKGSKIAREGRSRPFIHSDARAVDMTGN